jgi:hypothetical protein
MDPTQRQKVRSKFSEIFGCSLLDPLHKTEQLHIHTCKLSYTRSGGIFPPFLTSALDEGLWSASRPCRFTPRERIPNTHRIGGWVDPVAYRNIFCPCLESNPGRPVRSSSLHRLSYTGLLCNGNDMQNTGDGYFLLNFVSPLNLNVASKTFIKYDEIYILDLVLIFRMTNICF